MFSYMPGTFQRAPSSYSFSFPFPQPPTLSLNSSLPTQHVFHNSVISPKNRKTNGNMQKTKEAEEKKDSSTATLLPSMLPPTLSPIPVEESFSSTFSPKKISSFPEPSEQLKQQIPSDPSELSLLIPPIAPPSPTCRVSHHGTKRRLSPENIDDDENTNNNKATENTQTEETHALNKPPCTPSSSYSSCVELNTRECNTHTLNTHECNTHTRNTREFNIYERNTRECNTHTNRPHSPPKKQSKTLTNHSSKEDEFLTNQAKLAIAFIRTHAAAEWVSRNQNASTDVFLREFSALEACLKKFPCFRKPSPTQRDAARHVPSVYFSLLKKLQPENVFSVFERPPEFLPF